MWQQDEIAVRAGTCSFDVKYLGCLEVFDSRGMPVCEEALKKLKTSKKRAIKSILYVNGDGLRVVDFETKGLLLDQTIEKVSFCAPDHNYDRGFSYICRDGTTRRWMCHGFMAIKETVRVKKEFEFFNYYSKKFFLKRWRKDFVGNDFLKKRLLKNKIYFWTEKYFFKKSYLKLQPYTYIGLI